MKLTVRCDWCGKTMERNPSHIHRHNFCCRQCLAYFSSKRKNPDGYTRLKDFTNMTKHLVALNRRLNPSRMTPAVREKLHQKKLDSGNGLSYRKNYGRHEHRTVAEDMLGRALRPGEVVHHLDGDKRNNAPENLLVFQSQKEHARFHVKLYKFFMDGGDAQ